MYERMFNPADYDTDVVVIKEIAKKNAHITDSIATTLETAVAETIQGFRIQILSSNDIDEASKVKNDAQQILERDNVYLVFDAPYYKVRVGDFQTKPDANKMLKFLNERGFTDAWIVPDKVMKNPPQPKKPPPEQK